MISIHREPSEKMLPFFDSLFTFQLEVALQRYAELLQTSIPPLDYQGELPGPRYYFQKISVLFLQAMRLHAVLAYLPTIQRLSI